MQMRIKLETGTVIWFDPAENGSFRHSLRILNCIGEGGTGMIYTATDDDGITWVVKETFPNIGNSVLSPIRVCRKTDGNITMSTENDDRDLISEANRIMENESKVALCLQNDLTNRIMNMPFYTGALKGAAIQCPGRAVPTACDQLFSRMQYVKGVTADKASFANDLERLKTVRDILEAVAKIHQAGFILGDIKPQNIMITDSGRCFILDYGSAVKTNDRGETEIDPLTYPCSSGYIAPELFDPTGENACLTKAYDVYSLGALLI
jgi:serine/threonine protein kinase